MSNTKNSSESQDSRNSRKGTEEDTEENMAENRRPKPMEVLREARAQLAELTGMNAENVSSFEQTEDGWALEIEVLELTRVPDTMSLMASYQVELDPEGQLTGYRRVRRYERGRADAQRRGGH
ncbi:gas vesicle protein GvpO [Streptomyces pseudovenezuelae]|uniref:gas vesicle protein GvpO n=1 Tax=Streptomyces pseudovenezuelae TaxID=67350 RepID=UPI002E823B4D|nr:gas vesicle protein [Streptomyces pseudovenezuelae]WUA87308.1 gas vesicle protein [Streptomyces pseudovenezuelae]